MIGLLSLPLNWTSGAGVVATPSPDTLRWRLEAYPATQSSGATRTLLKVSRNAIIVRDIVDVESDSYRTPTTVTWSIRDGATVVASGSLALAGDRWRGEIMLDPAIATGTSPVLRIVATLGGASWSRDYPVVISEQA